MNFLSQYMEANNFILSFETGIPVTIKFSKPNITQSNLCDLILNTFGRNIDLEFNKEKEKYFFMSHTNNIIFSKLQKLVSDANLSDIEIVTTDLPDITIYKKTLDKLTLICYKQIRMVL